MYVQKGHSGIKSGIKNSEDFHIRWWGQTKCKCKKVTAE